MSAINRKASTTKGIFAILLVVFLTGCGCNLENLLDVTAPRVISGDTDPPDEAVDVAVGSNITAYFSEAMDPSTITSATFMVTRSDGATVAGTIAISANGRVATFTPSNGLTPDSEYTITIKREVQDAAGNPLANDVVWSFTTAPNALDVDNTAPAVSLTSPADRATGVAINKQIAATFSESMNASSIFPALTVSETGQGPLVGTIVYDVVSKIATFTPEDDLASNTNYTAVLTTGARDLAGNRLARNFVWSFTTGSTPDTTRPLVNGTIPGDGAANVLINTKISGTFTEAMDSLTINETSFTLVSEVDGPVPGNVSYAAVGNAATFAPLNNLAPNTLYTATLTTAIQDLAGNSLVADTVWTFRAATTSDDVDEIAPTVNSTNPANNATNVPINQKINATFSEAMDPLSISTASYIVNGPGETSVLGTVFYDVPSNIATFVPLLDLMPNTDFTASMTTGVSDLAGRALDRDYVWVFTTAEEPAGQSLVDFQSAATFAILAGAGITNVNNPGTIVNGDMGTSPTASVSGFPPGVLNGSLHAADPVVESAKLNLTTAYNDAAGRSRDVVIVADGELGGLTLAPGLYRSAPGSFAITSVDLTLDAQGDANAVYIFQMPSSTLTVGNDRQVILSGGARAANIFWQVGTSATLGTTSVFKGTIMADQAITLETGATLDGRAFARIAAVTLDTNVITIPSP